MTVPHRGRGRTTLALNDPARIRQPRRMTGQPPDVLQNPALALDLWGPDAQEQPGDSPALHWYVTVLRSKIDGRPDPDRSWLNLKMWSSMPVLHKANFWIAWHPEGKRLNRRADTSALEMLRPKLATFLSEALIEMDGFLSDDAGFYLVNRQASGVITCVIDPVSQAFTTHSRLTVTGANQPRIQEMTRLYKQLYGAEFDVQGDLIRTIKRTK